MNPGPDPASDPVTSNPVTSNPVTSDPVTSGPETVNPVTPTPARPGPDTLNPPRPRVVLLGVRHHGPGSARSVSAALERLAPDRILIEGPIDADPLVPLAGSAGMEPPVALLAYREQDPRISAFWPFASFSPEWVALRYGLSRGVRVGFLDLPAAISLGLDRDGAGDGPDPLARLAAAAGHADPEVWWEDVVEHRGFGQPGLATADTVSGSAAPLAAFSALADAMAAVREGEPTSEFDALREAHMRTVLRAALADGAQCVAVICGAYHVPALSGVADEDGRATITAPSSLASAAADKALLAKAPKPTKATATALTWVPWTHSRLSYHSGYGAGIGSPGWYRHLFETEDHLAERWLIGVAELLRTERFPVSSAHLIEAVRLAEALAALRGRPLPGLPELTEATLATLCEGHEEPLDLIGREMVVGDALGEVPSDAPTVPLAADLAREAKRLRVPKAATEKQYDLDLRSANDLGRSKLFHRLGLLCVDWAVNIGSRGTGTFRESWRVAWEPVFEVKLVEAAIWGTTVLAAATARALDTAAQTDTLGSLTVLVERCLTADLPDAVEPLIDLVKNRAALDTDIADLATALPPLANILRYGDVRGTQAGGLGTVVDGIAVRIAIGLPAACAGVDDDAARALAPSLVKVHAAIQTLDDEAIGAPWIQALRQVADLAAANGLLVGRATRLLRDSGRFSTQDVTDRMARALSPGTPPPSAAAWLEGFLADSGLLLAHDKEMLRLIDRWLAGLEGERFDEVLPLLRRTFSTFTAPERRTIGERLKAERTAAEHTPGEGPDATVPYLTVSDETTAAWVAAALPTIELLLTGHLTVSDMPGTGNETVSDSGLASAAASAHGARP